ncbi:MAG: formate/nitrite transporter family protein [Muribaculaceae bacterium]
MQKRQHQLALAAGIAKANRPIGRLVVLSMLAGAFIALGGVLSLILGSGFPAATAVNPSLGRLLSGLAFPVGLFMIVMTGADLFTGNNALLMPGALRRDISAGRVLANWVMVWVGNFAGALALTYFLVYQAGLVDSEPYRSAIATIAQTKTSLSPAVIFLRGIGANWCVCLAVWFGLTADNIAHKAVACWIPVAVFVILGFEHCIANMFYIPCGMMCGAAVSVADMAYNLLWSTLGNVVGGALLVGILFHFLYKEK